MKKNSWKFFVIIGILLVIAGAYVYPLDRIVGWIGLLFGAYNIFKGIRLARGKQPYLIRKQRESLENDKQELRDKIDKSSRNNKNN